MSTCSKYALIALIIIAAIAGVQAQVQDSLLLAGINLVHQEQFADAFVLFDSAIALAPEKPVGYFFKAAAFASIAGDYRNMTYTDSFFTYVDQAIEIGETREESGSATVEDVFFYGGAVGYRGIYKSFLGDWIGAFKDGLRGRGILERAYEMDSTFYDIYYGLGEYDYWRSAKTKVLWWLPFFSDKREEGIRQIYIAVEKGKLSRSEAKYGLLKIYENEKDYQAILDLWDKYLEALNPDDPFALYYVAKSHVELGNYEKAVKIYRKLLNIYLQSPYYDPGGALDVFYSIGMAYYRWDNFQEAVNYFKLASDLTETMSSRKDIEDAYKNSSKMLKKAKKALDKK